ncbi:anti-oxidant AhpCTSA family protein [Colwellia sp. MT41]|uniref:2-Cys peroxiredoxin n=1 Tax=Colwellia marinimaniae TaxID=1513592 RepID=A0ABQ0MSH6_9GAMM|nr:MULTISPECIES: thiol peroxidase [Colwellia]ALO35404.1 anti-oxidant AhpCTSA family protein [Colwellia sp. MT41]GAW95305.1 2-Cys peroxiredoxin [Colwellia marinimaniae]
MKFPTSNITLCAFFIASFTLAFNCQAYSFDLDKLKQSNNLVKAGDKYVTLLGQQVKVGEQAPPFTVVDKNFAPVSLKDFQGQTLLISVVPSLDTGVCSIQTKRFNEEAAKLPKNITVLTISNDLPFAQKRFCDVEKIDSIKVLSDSVWREFGTNYGLLIKDMGLLTRAIFVIDNQGKIVYKELVANISQQPNYDKALAKVRYTAPVIVVNAVAAKEAAKKTEK